MIFFAWLGWGFYLHQRFAWPGFGFYLHRLDFSRGWALDFIYTNVRHCFKSFDRKMESTICIHERISEEEIQFGLILIEKWGRFEENWQVSKKDIVFGLGRTISGKNGDFRRE